MKIQYDPEELSALAVALVPHILEALQPAMIKNKKTAEPEEGIFSVKTLASHLGVSVDWVYKNAETGTLPYFKCGRHLRFKRAEIRKWIDQNSVKP